MIQDLTFSKTHAIPLRDVKIYLKCRRTRAQIACTHTTYAIIAFGIIKINKKKKKDMRTRTKENVHVTIVRDMYEILSTNIYVSAYQRRERVFVPNQHCAITMHHASHSLSRVGVERPNSLI